MSAKLTIMVIDMKSLYIHIPKVGDKNLFPGLWGVEIQTSVSARAFWV